MQRGTIYLLFLILLTNVGLWGCKSKNLAESEKQVMDIKQLEAKLNQPLPENARKKVLILHSYHREYIWVRDVNEGIIKGLQEEHFETGSNLTLDYFYMDTKRKTDENWKLTVAAKAKQHIAEFGPHVVIAVDDNAQKYVVGDMAKKGYQFVFTGVNADPMTFGYINNMDAPGGQVTGSIERERFAQTIGLLRQLVPKVEKLAVICDDGPTGVPIIKRIQEKAESLGTDIVALKQTGQFSEWKQFIKEIQTQADALLVILYHTLKDNTGHPVHENVVLNWTINNSRLPDMGIWSWAVEGGLLCSEAISGYQQGHYAATVASYVLMGQTAGEFPVGKPQRGEVCINTARAKMLGIQIPDDIARTAILYQTIGGNGQ
jgi:ABC-type uncharacterized transport system substrate-binding protein